MIKWSSTFAWLLLSVACTLLRAESSPAGGRDVSVVLFSTRTLHKVTLAPLDANAWTSSCTRCAHKSLTTPLQLSEKAELFAGGHLRITNEDTHEQRNATGLWHLRFNAGSIDVVLTLPSEHYVAAVLNAETNAAEPAASLQALAIVARTYALNGSHYRPAPGHLAADLCDSTECQAMRLGPVSPPIEAAVRATTGETLWFHAGRALVFFSEHCGGVTEDPTAAWPALRGVPYLTSHHDPYCLRRGPAAWHAEIALKDFTAIASAQGWHLPSGIESARVVRRSTSQRPVLIEFSGPGSAKADVSAGALRFALDRALGWNQIRSGQYDIAVHRGHIVFDGRGYGHGVGLCQAGATEMAAEHKGAADILAFYFPGTTIGIGPGDSGWLTTRAGSLTIRTIHPLAAERLSTIERLWQQAMQHFTSHQNLKPEIVVAPSVEIFRQLTGQPGWVAASTSGSQIVLEPAEKLGSLADATLLHEMLHVLVESEAANHAPLWLREGLVAELTGEWHSSLSAVQPVMQSASLDQALLHPASQAEDEHAHLAAAARVHALILRYGFSVVRGWLESGVPPGIAQNDTTTDTVVNR